MSRIKINLNWEQIQALCGLMCTVEEIASIFKCNRKTIYNRCLKEQHMNFDKFFDKYSGTGKVSIRRDLFNESKGGNVAASIFLAKNYLGMKDVSDIRENVTINKAEELSDAELEVIARGKPSKRGTGTTTPPPVQISPN